MGQWFADHADKITHHAHLAPVHTATTVRLDQGEPVVTDGPFVEGKEVVSGFAELEVADLDEALKVARSWPSLPDRGDPPPFMSGPVHEEVLAGVVREHAG
ncbi:YciI family protein [Nonomuraea ferruginea]